VLVVDASAVAELILDTDVGARVLDHLGDHTLHAPDVIGLEVVSVLRKLMLADELDRREATAALQRCADLGIEIYDHSPLLVRCLELADNATPYDAAYVALAEGLDAAVLTCDSKLAGVPGTRATFLLVT
jgi:predicted nucleic acid-binding protein